MGAKKISISLPESLLEALDSLAKEEGVPRSRILAEALRLYLKKQGLAEEPKEYPTVLWKLKSSGTLKLRSHKRIGRRIRGEWVVEINGAEV